MFTKDKKELLIKLLNENKTYNYIFKQEGIVRKEVVKFLACNPEIKEIKKQNKNKKNINIIDDYLSKIPVKKICEKYNIKCISILYSILEKYNIKPNRKKNNIIKSNKKNLILKTLNEKKSNNIYSSKTKLYQDVARELNCSIYLVKQYFYLNKRINDQYK